MHSHQEIERLLIARWDEIRREKALLKENIENWDNKLKELKRLAGSVPKESDQELSSQIEALERKHTTTSQTKAQEGDLLHEIKKLKLKRKEASTYNKFSGEIELLKSQLAAARNDLLEKESALDDLASGLRKVRLAARAGVNSSELVETTFSIQEEKIPLLVGKGGMNIRSIEGDFSVAVEIDHLKLVVRVTGLPSGIVGARKAIEVAMDTITEEFAVSYETSSVLTMGSLAILQKLEKETSTIIELLSTKSFCRITGLTANVEQAKKGIMSLPCSRMELRVERSFFPSIIGKGGSNIRALESSHNVNIHLQRDDDVIEIVGLKSDVSVAAKIIHGLVEDNREIEKEILVSKYILLGILIQDLKNIQKNYSVKIDVEGSKENKIHNLKVRGIRIKVCAAEAHIQSIIELFKAQSLSIEVADEIIPAIVGKGGAGIKLLREKYPGANIDIDGTTLLVHSSSSIVREQISEEILQVIGDNYVETIQVSEDFAIMLKTERCAGLRDQLSTQLNVRMIIDKDGGFVKFKGNELHVKKAMQIIEVQKSNFTSGVISVLEEDFSVLQRPDENFIRSLEESFGIDIAANKKNFSLTLRGEPKRVEEASDRIIRFLGGDRSLGSQVVFFDESMSAALIGKGGANLKKLECELGAKIDVLKSRKSIRIRSSVETLDSAVIAFRKYLSSCRISVTVSISTKLEKSRVDEICRRLHDVFSAELVPSESGFDFQIRCSYQVRLEAKEYFEELVSGHGVFVLPLLDQHSKVLSSLPDYGLSKFKRKLTILCAHNELRISGSSAVLHAAKREIMRIVHALLPKETAFIEVPCPCLRSIVSPDLVVSLETVGALVSCDRVQGFLWLVCSQTFLQSAQLIVENSLSSWKDRSHIFSIDDFMIPLIVGKNGSVINSLRKEWNCELELDRFGKSLLLSVDSKDSLVLVLPLVQQWIEKIRNEHWETKMHPSLAPILIGKGGSNINKFRDEMGVNIDVDSNGLVRLTGPQELVPSAVKKIMEFIQREERYVDLPRTFALPPSLIPIIIGPKGETIRELQAQSGAKIDLNRDTKKCVLRGRNEDCEKAFNLLNDILRKEGYAEISRLIDKEAESFGSDDDMVEERDAGRETVPRSLLSKSALKRLRRKERLIADAGHVNDHDDGHDSDLNCKNKEKDDCHISVITPPSNEDYGMKGSIATLEDASLSSSTNKPAASFSISAQSREVSNVQPQLLVDFLLGKSLVPSLLSSKQKPLADSLAASRSPDLQDQILPKSNPPDGCTSSNVRPTAAPSIGFTSYRSVSSKI